MIICYCRGFLKYSKVLSTEEPAAQKGSADLKKVSVAQRERLRFHMSQLGENPRTKHESQSKIQNLKSKMVSHQFNSIEYKAWRV
ncbi:hypothetical protein NIES4103_48230 [Nostoc sp. NIES-4103]|nr:hypothetical protein NIES4103_48230 [Nostoc sp. NIES-4103]